MSIREFARLALPIYRAERWRWTLHGQSRVPTEAQIVATIKDLIRGKRLGSLSGFPWGYVHCYRWSRTGGLQVEYLTPKRYGIWMYGDRHKEILAEIIL